MTLSIRTIVLRRKLRGRVRLANSDRWLFVQLYRWFPSILQVFAIIRPETLIRWHRSGFRCYWRGHVNAGVYQIGVARRDEIMMGGMAIAPAGPMGMALDQLSANGWRQNSAHRWPAVPQQEQISSVLRHPLEARMNNRGNNRSEKWLEGRFYGFAGCATGYISTATALL